MTVFAVYRPKRRSFQLLNIRNGRVSVSSRSANEVNRWKLIDLENVQPLYDPLYTIKTTLRNTGIALVGSEDRSNIPIFSILGKSSTQPQLPALSAYGTIPLTRISYETDDERHLFAMLLTIYEMTPQTLRSIYLRNEDRNESIREIVIKRRDGWWGGPRLERGQFPSFFNHLTLPPRQIPVNEVQPPIVLDYSDPVPTPIPARSGQYIIGFTPVQKTFKMSGFIAKAIARDAINQKLECCINLEPIVYPVMVCSCGHVFNNSVFLLDAKTCPLCRQDQIEWVVIEEEVNPISV